MHSAIGKTVVIVLLLFPLVGLTQDRAPKGEFQSGVSPVTFEVVAVFGRDTSKAHVNLHYRIPRSFFVFVRPGDNAASKDELSARGQLQIELFNEQDVSVARSILPFALKKTSLRPANEQPEDIEGGISFALPYGDYHVIFEVDDLESGRAFLDKKHTVKARKASLKSLDLSFPFFATIDSTQSHAIQFNPFNHGSNIFFGNVRGGMVCQIYCPDCDSALNVRWNLHGETEDRAGQVQDFNGTRFQLVDGQLSMESKEGPVTYTVQSSGPAWKILYIPVPLERLNPGRYNIVLNATDGKEKFKNEISFQVIWPNRPMSLTDWDMATDALRYIAKPEELDEILSSSSERSLKAFRAFWQKHDPDTTTAYNQVMVEYYRRVDEAIRQFSTMKDRDGYKTDRGRIYILFGPPTRMDRSLLPDQPARDIWTYTNIKKRFIFTERNKSGNYILTQTDNL